MSDAELRADVPGASPAEHVDTDTWQMWAIALLPLASLPLSLIPGSGTLPTDASSTVTWSPEAVVALLISLALLATEVALAVSDRRELIRRGVVRPMHPGWALLDVVYVIGRSVVVRRRVHGSLRPLWVWVTCTVVTQLLLNLPR